MSHLVSILIPCYNADRWVGEAIESALAQTWPEKEIIVIDDGSTDSSLKVIQSFGDRIRWESGSNRGSNATRNRLLKLARAEWVQYLDADDYLLPEKIEGQMAFVEENPDTEVVFSRFIVENSQGPEIRRYVSVMPDPQDPWILLVRWELGQTGGPLWRKPALIDVGGWKADQPCCQEYELFLRLLIAGKRFAYCSKYGAVYRQWSSGSVCTRNPAEVQRNRVHIVGRAEYFLRERGELTSERLSAINQARFEVARLAWQYDPDFSIEIDKAVRRSQSRFTPGGPGARIKYRFAYRLGYRLLGFQRMEKIAYQIRIFTGAQQV